MMLLVVTFVTFSSVVVSYNVDTESATVYEYKGGANHSLFGAVVGQTDKTVLIGAPEDSSKKGRGSLYACKPGKATSCKRLPYHREAIYWNISVFDKLGAADPKETKGQKSEVPQPRLTCLSPGRSAKVFKSDLKHGYGTCWDSTQPCPRHKDGHVDSGEGKIDPKNLCLDQTHFGLLKGGKRELLMVNRGSWSSQGLFNSITNSNGSNYDPFLFIKTTKSGKVWASTSSVKGSKQHKGYIGLSSVVVNKRGEEETVVGVPFDGSNTGSIQFFDERLNNVGSVSGKRSGQGFGSALTVTDLNGDGDDEIVVGAPDFANPTDPQGAVYIFHFIAGRGYSFDHSEVINGGGKEMAGHFGSVVSGLGDINNDGYNDLAVGIHALEGKVAIFHGSKAGVSKEPAQVIYGSDFTPPIRHLGVAISSLDQDGKGSPDILIGGADKAVYLKTRPVVYASLGLTSTPMEVFPPTRDCSIGPENNKVPCSEILICVSYHVGGGKKLRKHILDSISTSPSFVLEVLLDTDQMKPRVLFKIGDTSSRNISINKLIENEAYCKPNWVYFKEEPSWDFDIFSPVKVKAVLHLEAKREEKTKGNTPLLPMLAPVQVYKEMNIVSDYGCGYDHVCVPDLFLNGSLSYEDIEPGVPGMQLTATVGNNGEYAFRVQLLIRHPEGVRCWSLLHAHRMNCSRTHEDSNPLQEKCNVRKLLAPREEVSYTYAFGLTPGVNESACISESSASNLTLMVDSRDFSLEEDITNNHYVIPYTYGIHSQQEDMEAGTTIIPGKEEASSGTTTSQTTVESSDSSIAATTSDDGMMLSSSPWDDGQEIDLHFFGYPRPEAIDGSFQGPIRHYFVVSNAGRDSLSDNVELKIIWPALHRVGGHPSVMEKAQIVTGKGKCSSAKPACGPLLFSTEKWDTNKTEIFVESAQDCTLVTCLIEHLDPGSNFTVKLQSLTDASNFLQGRTNDEDVDAYYFITRASISMKNRADIPQRSYEVLTKLTPTQKMPSSSERISGGLWACCLLQLLIAFAGSL